MSIFIFLLVLGLLIFVHELGHFVAAKRSGVKVHEFALGFPPTLAKKKIGGTVYKLNLLPLGGYVNLEGENGEGGEDVGTKKTKKEGAPEDIEGGELKKGPEGSFSSKGPITKTIILIAGVTMNILLAWVLLSICFMIGYPTISSEVDPKYIKSENAHILETVPGSPAAEVGLRVGDVVYEISDEESSQLIESSDEIGNFIQNSDFETIQLTVIRGGEEETFSITTTTELDVETEGEDEGGGVTEGRKMIGISTQNVAIAQYPLHLALVRGAEWTYVVTSNTVEGVRDLITDAFRGKADMSNVAGPIGIVNLVGQAYETGIIYLLSFTAMISVNLAVINLIPIPALDGGRILFTWIEVLKGSPIKMKTQMIANGIGFALLILLMIFISVQDILKIFN